MFLYVCTQQEEALTQMQAMFSRAEEFTKKEVCIGVISKHSTFNVEILE